MAVKEESQVTELELEPTLTTPTYRYEDDPPDGGWGWLVVLASHIGLLLSYGSSVCFGPFIVRLNDYFDDGAGVIGGISGMAILVSQAIGPISAALMNRYSCRVVVFTGGVISSLGFLASSFVTEVHHLYITYGLITGLGYGLIITPAMAFPARYFKKRYTFANGLAYAGNAIAWIAMAPLSQFFIEMYGWRGAMLIFSAIQMHVCLFSLLLRPPPQKRILVEEGSDFEKTEQELLVVGTDTDRCTSKHDNSDESAQVSAVKTEDARTCISNKPFRSCINLFDLSLFLNPLFVLLCIDYVMFAMGFFPTMLFLVARALSYDIPAPLPTSLLMITGASSLVGRVSHGVIIDSKIITSVQGLAGGLMICGLINLFSVLTTSYTGLAIMYAVFGFSNGIYNPLSTVVIKDFVGVKKLPYGQGLCQIFRGIGGLIGPPVTGLIFDANQSYNMCYIYSGSMLFLSGFILVFVPCIRKCRPKEEILD
ncbi:monocarboxylate transporter 13-like [Glandiceps talaboti]